MPNIKSAVKRMKTSERCHQRNKAASSRVASSCRKMLETVESGNKANAEANYVSFCAELDKAAKKGVLSPNAAARRKSRMVKHIAAMA